jgi:hypothetical protein
MIQLKGEKMNEHHKKQIEVIREIEAQVHRAGGGGLVTGWRIIPAK